MVRIKRFAITPVPYLAFGVAVRAIALAFGLGGDVGIGGDQHKFS